MVDTPIGRLGCAICYDWLFPEAMRQLAANGAEVLIRVSAYMDPWGATEPMAWWTVINRARAIENVAYVVAANQGASLRALSAVLVAGRQPGRRLRRPPARRGLTRARRAHRRRADRHRRRCATSARSAAAITCWRTCAPRRIRSIGRHDLSACRRRAADLRAATSPVSTNRRPSCSGPMYPRARSPTGYEVGRRRAILWPTGFSPCGTVMARCARFRLRGRRRPCRRRW